MSSKKISLLPLYSGDPAGTYLVMNNAGETGSFKVLRETIIGASGSAGTSGTSGSAGTSGTSGSAGTSGTSGSAGTSGTSGASGSAGTSGSSGTSGVNGSSGTSGSNGTSGSTGTSGSAGTSGTSGISGYVDNDWLYFKPTTATIPSTGNNFVLSGTTTSNGSVSYNDTNGIITLAANKTYKLSASFALANSINNAEAQYQWINVTASNTLIGNTGAVIVVNSSASAAWQPSAEAIIVTTGTTQVALRSTFANSTGDFATSMCFMMVNQINGWSGSSGTSGSAGTSGLSGSAGTSGTSSNAKTTGNWTLATGANTVSFTVTAGQSYVMWVNGNIPNGIVNWNATVTLSNSNVPVIGVQYGWYYLAGNALALTSIPAQIIGTAGSISTSMPSVTNSNTFTFGITNNSGTSQTVYYGYTQI
jgi:hypothetical protein